MCTSIKEGIKGKRNVLYTRLLFKIFRQEKLVQKLQCLGTCKGRMLSGVTLRSMKIIPKNEVITSDQDLQTSLNQTAYFDDFPPISKEDPLEVLA